MRKSLLVIVALLAAATVLLAQDQSQPSLADLARQQKAKEKSKPAHVFTNDNIPRSGDAVSTGTGAAPGAAPVEASAAASDDTAKPADAKPAPKAKVDKDRVNAAQAEVAKWQKELQDLDAIKAKLAAKVDASETPAERDTYQEMLSHVPGKEAEAQQKLAAAQQELQAAQNGEAPAAGESPAPAPAQGEAPANPPAPNSSDSGSPQ